MAAALSQDQRSAQVHPARADQQLIHVQAVREAAVDATQGQLGAADARGYMPHHQVHPGLGVEHIPAQCQRQCERREDEGRKQPDEPNAYHSLGEKLMSKRGEAPGREIDWATSMPNVTTGSRQRGIATARLTDLLEETDGASLDIDAEEAWNVTTGAGATVAVVDTGIDAGHPDFTDQIAATEGLRALLVGNALRWRQTHHPRS